MPDFDNSFLAQDDHPSVHEDAIVFEIKGQPVGWRASGLALKRAADQGHDVGEILADLQVLFSADVDKAELEEMSEEEIEEELDTDVGMADFYSVVAKTIWVGVLHFEPNARQNAVLGLLDAESIADVPTERMLSKIFPALTGEEGAEGKGKGQASDG